MEQNNLAEQLPSIPSLPTTRYVIILHPAAHTHQPRQNVVVRVSPWNFAYFLHISKIWWQHGISWQGCIQTNWNNATFLNYIKMWRHPWCSDPVRDCFRLFGYRKVGFSTIQQQVYDKLKTCFWLARLKGRRHCLTRSFWQSYATHCARFFRTRWNWLEPK